MIQAFTDGNGGYYQFEGGSVPPWAADMTPTAVQPSPEPGIPQTVTRFQALAALHLAGYLPAVQAIMAAPETPVLAKLAWDNALSFERTSPTLASLAAVLGLSPAQLDGPLRWPLGLKHERL